MPKIKDIAPRFQNVSRGGLLDPPTLATFCCCGLNSGWLRLYKIFQEAAPPISDLRLMCHLLNNCSLYMSIIFLYF